MKKDFQKRKVTTTTSSPNIYLNYYKVLPITDVKTATKDVKNKSNNFTDFHHSNEYRHIFTFITGLMVNIDSVQ